MSGNKSVQEEVHPKCAPVQNHMTRSETLNEPQRFHLRLSLDRLINLDPTLSNNHIVILHAHAPDPRERFLRLPRIPVLHEPARRFGSEVDSNAEDKGPEDVE